MLVLVSFFGRIKNFYCVPTVLSSFHLPPPKKGAQRGSWGTIIIILIIVNTSMVFFLSQAQFLSALLMNPRDGVGTIDTPTL